MLSEEEIKLACNFSIRNWPQIVSSKYVGCYYCLKIFPATKIIDVPDKSGTALCPYCNTDSLLGDSSPYTINLDNLKTLQKNWFRHSTKSEK